MGAIYLYGIVEAANGFPAGIAGVDGAGPVGMVARDGLGGVVSPYCGEDLRGLPKEELLKRLFAHQQVVEWSMGYGTVLPVKFGTVLGDTQEVLALLSQGQVRLAGAIASIRDKVEIEVAATWDVNRVLKEIANEEEIVRAREAMTRKSYSSLEERIQVGQIVKACLDRRRASYRERMINFLKPFAVEVASNALVAEEMVMNVAFLVERSRQQELDEQIHRLDKLFHSEIAFRVVGPLPPYSFSTVEIAQLTPEQVGEAQRMLHLGEVISERAVRRAYRHLVAGERNASNALQGGISNGRLAALRHASQLLLHYCQAQEESGGNQRRYAPAPENCGRLFAIAVKRAGGEEMEPTRFGGAMKV